MKYKGSRFQPHCQQFSLFCQTVVLPIMLRGGDSKSQPHCQQYNLFHQTVTLPSSLRYKCLKLPAVYFISLDSNTAYFLSNYGCSQPLRSGTQLLYIGCKAFSLTVNSLVYFARWQCCISIKLQGYITPGSRVNKLMYGCPKEGYC